MTLHDFLEEWNDSRSVVCAQTSGSTGVPKTIEIEKKRMIASAEMTCDFLCLKPGQSALLCMSLQHIGAKMMVVRALVRHLRLIEVTPCGHPLSQIEEIPDFAAMVPLQVYNSLQISEERDKLKRIKNLIIGGGSIDPNMERQLQKFPNAVWSTYGMTETLSHIALRRISGEKATEWYTPLPHIKIYVNGNGCLCIKASSLCPHDIETNDIAQINSATQEFKIIGRTDNTINSGGIKIQTEDVEKRLGIESSPTFAIGAAPDEKFGQIVVLLTTPQTPDSITEKIELLPAYWKPKRKVQTDSIPLTANGKIDRKSVTQKILNCFNIKK